MSPISFLFLGLCAFLFGFWLVRQLERRRFKPSDSQPPHSPSASAMAVRPAISNRSQPPDKLKDDVRQLVFQGRKIEAIKRVREQTGWSLKQAKNYVELDQQPAFSNSLDPDVVAAAQQLLTSNQKIAALKLIRARTGWGLEKTKDYIEKLHED
ncbi:MAG: hypothetical protein AAF622_02600 [Cyanobacteria bacterium P01_C01_bin.147]